MNIAVHGEGDKLSSPPPMTKKIYFSFPLLNHYYKITWKEFFSKIIRIIKLVKFKNPDRDNCSPITITVAHECNTVKIRKKEKIINTNIRNASREGEKYAIRKRKKWGEMSQCHQSLI